MSAGATAKVGGAHDIASIFESLEYGPAPEADNVVKVWQVKFY